MKATKTLRDLQGDVGRWSEATFGKQSVLGKIKHLRREVDELLSNPQNIGEMADCRILLVDIARLLGVNGDRLLQSAFEKLAINKLRRWQPPDEHGVSEHMKGQT